MPWSEFVSLLSGLGPNTSLARLVEIRLEDDKDILSNFTPAQMRIRNEYRRKRNATLASSKSLDETIQFLNNMKNIFIQMS